MRHRVGTVSYLNARPLTAKLGDQIEVVRAFPSVIARRLAEGDVELALVPVASALTDGDLRILGGVCIGADGPVHSVVLTAEGPPETWRRVVLDGVSRTSAVLARLLLAGPLRGRVRDDLEVVTGELESGVPSARGETAALVIGDAAMHLPERLTTRIDLAEVWREWTGLPFVFAVWAGRPGTSRALLDHVRAAGIEGVAARSVDYAGEELRYLTQNIRYELDDRALIGLRRFAALGAEAGLLGSADVRFFAPDASRARAETAAILARGAGGERLTASQGTLLATDARIADLIAAADLRRGELHATDVTTWRLGRSLTLPTADVTAWVRDSVEAGVTSARLAMPTGAAPVSEAVVTALSVAGLGVRAFTPSELDAWAAREGRPAVAERLVRAGLSDLDGAASLADLPLWLDWWGALIEAGATPTVALRIGPGEAAADRVAALAKIRDLQDRTGGVAAVRIELDHAEDAEVRILGNTASDLIRTVAVARLFLDNVVQLSADWSNHGEAMAQACLQAGCDDLGTRWLSDDVATWSAATRRAERIMREVGRPGLREVLSRPAAVARDAPSASA